LAVNIGSNELEDFLCHKHAKLLHTITMCHIYLMYNYTFLCIFNFFGHSVTLCHSVTHVMGVTHVTYITLVTNIKVMCHSSSNGSQEAF
jgi:hypothetical protein